jgi:hypothetical protein
MAGRGTQRALGHAEGCLLHVGFMHSHLMVAGMQILLGEEFGAMQLIRKFFHHRNREFIFDGGAIQCSVVDAEAPSIVPLLHQQYMGRVHRLARPNDPLVK